MRRILGVYVSNVRKDELTSDEFIHATSLHFERLFTVFDQNSTNNDCLTTAEGDTWLADLI